jgi:hypothetical protein
MAYYAAAQRSPVELHELMSAEVAYEVGRLDEKLQDAVFEAAQEKLAKSGKRISKAEVKVVRLARENDDTEREVPADRSDKESAIAYALAARIPVEYPKLWQELKPILANSAVGLFFCRRLVEMAEND